MPVANEEPITQWIRQLEAGRPDAAQPLWDHFCQRLIQLAQQRLPNQLRTTYDHDDVAVSAFHSLCRAVVRPETSPLQDRFNFWRLLATIAERKIMQRLRDERRDKRNVDRRVAESCLATPDESSLGLDGLPSREPTPEFAAEFADLCDSLILSLPDDTLRQIAQLKLSEHSTQEIAQRLECTPRTIERKLLLIRAHWQDELEKLVF